MQTRPLKSEGFKKQSNKTTTPNYSHATYCLVTKDKLSRVFLTGPHVAYKWNTLCKLWSSWVPDFGSFPNNGSAIANNMSMAGKQFWLRNDNLNTVVNLPGWNTWMLEQLLNTPILVSWDLWIISLTPRLRNFLSYETEKSVLMDRFSTKTFKKKAFLKRTILLCIYWWENGNMKPFSRLS